ncbi:MAG: hypothetical protein PUP91_30405 [Rhizonema sp. PD37]|nr:hypothetical protein [Rhizonema sp. PD37]
MSEFYAATHFRVPIHAIWFLLLRNLALTQVIILTSTLSVLRSILLNRGACILFPPTFY